MILGNFSGLNCSSALASLGTARKPDGLDPVEVVISEYYLCFGEMQAAERSPGDEARLDRYPIRGGRHLDGSGEDLRRRVDLQELLDRRPGDAARLPCHHVQ